MAKAMKKSKNTTPDIEPSTSRRKSKKAKTYRQPTTCCYQCSGKVQKMKKKAKRTLPRIHKNNASKKTVPPTKKNKRANGEALFRRRSMDEMTVSTETDPEQSSSDSSTESSSDEESQ